MARENFNVVVEEAAEAEFDRFADLMDLDVGLDGLDLEDKTALLKQRRRVVVAIGRGALVVNDDGEAIYTPQNEKSKYDQPIHFHERTGASLMAMDRQKKNHDVAKMYAVLGDMCRVEAKIFAGLKGTDVKVCEALFSLLMD